MRIEIRRGESGATSLKLDGQEVNDKVASFCLTQEGFGPPMLLVAFRADAGVDLDLPDGVVKALESQDAVEGITKTE